MPTEREKYELLTAALKALGESEDKELHAARVMLILLQLECLQRAEAAEAT